jgi:hypothetical protein
MINLLEDHTSYAFVKGVLGWLLGGLLVGGFCYGYILLKKDNYQLVKEREVRLFMISFIQAVVFMVNWAIVEMSLLEYPSRVLKLVINIDITATFLYYILDEVYSGSIDKGFKLSISGAGILLLMMIFDRRVLADCGDNFWELYDLLYFISTSILVYVGCRAISDITSVENENIKQPSDPIAKQISLQLIRKDKSNFFYMVLGILFGCLLFLGIDLYKFYSETPEEHVGAQFFRNKSFLMKICLGLLEFLANALPMATIYYIYIIRNLSLLDYTVRPDTSLEDACDSLRSQMILEIELEEVKKHRESQSKFDYKINF